MFGRKKEKPIKPSKYTLKHIQGLDIPEITCTVELTETVLNIKGGGQEYNLQVEKINDVSFDMDVDVQKYSKSNIVAGVAGAVAFGAVGAVVGAAPRAKTQRLVTSCAVVGYTSSNGEQNYLILQNIQPNDLQAAKFVDTLRPLIKKQMTGQPVEL